MKGPALRIVLRIAVILFALTGVAGAAVNYTAPVPTEPLTPPAYPPEAAAAGFEGECSVSLLINASGEVGESWIAQSSGREDVDRAALEAAGATLWKPATLEGVPVSSRLTIPYRFELGVKPGDPLGPAVTGPIPDPESSEPMADLRPSEPIAVDFPDAGFAVVGLEVDDVGLVLDAWLIRSSGRQAADDALLDAVYAVLWEGSGDGLVRGVYVHDFRGGPVAETGEHTEKSSEDPTADEGGACRFDQLRLGKYGERVH
jgi:TonB family protein